MYHLKDYKLKTPIISTVVNYLTYSNECLGGDLGGYCSIKKTCSFFLFPTVLLRCLIDLVI